MPDDLPLLGDSQLLRVVMREEVSVFTGQPSSTAFEPRTVDSSAFKVRSCDKGLLSTEHGNRPGGAARYLSECGLSGVEGIWAVTVEECRNVGVPPLSDGGVNGQSQWHVSIDFRDFVNESMNLRKEGSRRARMLRDLAQERGQLA